MPNFPRRGVSLLNDDHTPMDFVVGVLEHFFGMSTDEAITQMYPKLSAAPTRTKKPRRKWRMSSRLLPSTNTRSNAFLSKRTNATAEDFCYWHLADIPTRSSDV